VGWIPTLGIWQAEVTNVIRGNASFQKQDMTYEYPDTLSVVSG